MSTDPRPSLVKISDVVGDPTLLEVTKTEPGDVLLVVRIPEDSGIDVAKLGRAISELLDDAGAPHHAIRKEDFDLGEWLATVAADPVAAFGPAPDPLGLERACKRIPCQGLPEHPLRDHVGPGVRT